MTKTEIKIALDLLAPLAERTETAIYNNGQCVTAYWVGGSYGVLYTLCAVAAKTGDATAIRYADAIDRADAMHDATTRRAKTREFAEWVATRYAAT